MKTKNLILLFVAVFILTSKNYSQFSFGVSPGIGFNSAYFGYKINDKIVPFIGFQYFNANFTYERSGEKYDWDLNKIVSFTDKNSFSGSLYVPNIGVKYFFVQKNKLQAYFSLSLSKPILSGKLVDSGTEDKDFKDAIESISMFGGEFGFGVEYFFDENFSIGGEFGLRYLHLSYDNTYQSEVYTPNTGSYKNTDINNDYSFNMSPTFSRISLNYYFK